MSMNDYYKQRKTPRSGEMNNGKATTPTAMQRNRSMGVSRGPVTSTPVPSTSKSHSPNNNNNRGYSPLSPTPGIPEKRRKLDHDQSVMISMNLFPLELLSTSKTSDEHQNLSRSSSMESVIEILPEPKLLCSIKQEPLSSNYADDYDWESDWDPDEVEAPVKHIIDDFFRDKAMDQNGVLYSNQQIHPSNSQIIDFEEQSEIGRQQKQMKIQLTEDISMEEDDNSNDESQGVIEVLQASKETMVFNKQVESVIKEEENITEDEFQDDETNENFHPRQTRNTKSPDQTSETQSYSPQKIKLRGEFESAKDRSKRMSYFQVKETTNRGNSDQKKSSKTSEICHENGESTSENFSTCSTSLDSINIGQTIPFIPKPPPADEHVLLSYSSENVVQNLNTATRKAVSGFNLKEIYAGGEFKFQWEDMDTIGAGINYNFEDIVPPVTERFKSLFEMICWVFSVPFNIGYFNDEERNFVFKILTLGEEKQYFLMEFIVKSENPWVILRKQNYEQLFDGNFETHFNEMVADNLFDCDYENDRSGEFFNIFKHNELTQLYRWLQLPSTTSKPRMISALQEILRNKNNTPRDKSRWQLLKDSLNVREGPIFKISETLISLINRILVLYHPTHNPEDQLVDVFSFFNQVPGEIKFPSYPILHLPFFKNRQSLIEYIKAKRVLMHLTEIINGNRKSPHHWQSIREYGVQAHTELTKLIVANDNEQLDIDLPSHIKRFSTAYMWSKVLILTSKSLKAKTPEDRHEAIEYLDFLIQNLRYLPVDLGDLYKELITLKMNSQENLNGAVELTVRALGIFQDSPLHVIHYAEMLKLARNLLEKTRGITQNRKILLQNILLDKEKQFMPKMVSQEVEVQQKNSEDGRKALWQMNSGAGVRVYQNIEDLAVDHYGRLRFPNSINCSTLPGTLFACLLWKEIYDIHEELDYSRHLNVPGAFVSKFQKEPLDLFDSGFYDNRRRCISKKIEFLAKHVDHDVLWNIMTGFYENSFQYQSIVSHSLGDVDNFRRIIMCLGKHAVLEICRIFIERGYEDWKVGFPDLFVWNEKTMQHKMIVLKNRKPLSPRQNLWVIALQGMGINVETFTVKVKRSDGNFVVPPEV